MDTFLLDLKLAFRGLLRAPGFALTALLTLALGIGANTAMFSLVDQTLLKPLPFRDPGRLVMVYSTNPSQGWATASMSAPNFQDYARENTTLESLIALSSQSMSLSGDGQPMVVPAGRVSAGFFGMLGVNPVLGRTFAKEDDAEGGAPVAVLTNELWRGRFGADPAIIGRSIRLDGIDTQVVGVLPPHFDFPVQLRNMKLFLTQPFNAKNLADRGNNYLRATGRLKPGVTAEAATRDLERVAAGLARAYPDNDQGWSATAQPLASEAVKTKKPVLLSLLGVVALVLLIACANVASLLIARGLGRRREVAIRSALGAGSGRLFRQLLTESVLLSVLGGLAGLALSRMMLDGLHAIAGGPEPSLDLIALGFTFLLSLATGLVFGSLPAWQATRMDLNTTLREESKGTATGATHRLRAALVVAEVAMATTLLIGAGLMVRNLWRLQSAPTGFRPDHALTATLALPQAKYSDPAAYKAFITGFDERLRGIPGAESAGITSMLPMGGSSTDSSYDAEGQAAPDKTFFDAFDTLVTPGYFSAMGIGLKEGRTFQASDSDSVCIVSERLASKHWPGQSALGRRVSFNGPSGPWFSIVGVARDVQQTAPGAPILPHIYRPMGQPLGSSLPLNLSAIVRSAGNPDALRGSVAKALADLDPDLATARIASMEEVVSSSLRQQQMMSLLFVIFALVALLLSAVGIYGLMSFVARQRTREIGIRMALGASVRDVLKLIVGQGARLVLAGAGAGLLAAAALTRLLESQLGRLASGDLATYLSVTALLGLVAVAACLLPALRAARVDPMIALRSE